MRALVKSCSPRKTGFSIARRPGTRPGPGPRRGELRLCQAILRRERRRAAGPVRGRRRGPRRRRPAQPPHAVVGEATQKVSEAFSVLGQETGPTARRRRRASRRRRSAELEEARQAQAALVHLRRPHLLPLRIRPRRVRCPRRADRPKRRRRREPDTEPGRRPNARAVHPVAPSRRAAARRARSGGLHARRHPYEHGSHAEVPVRVRHRRPRGDPRVGPRGGGDWEPLAVPVAHPAGINHQPRRKTVAGQDLGSSRVIPRLRAHLRGTRVRAERGRRVSRAVRGAARARRRVRRGWVRVDG